MVVFSDIKLSFHVNKTCEHQFFQIPGNMCMKPEDFCPDHFMKSYFLQYFCFFFFVYFKLKYLEVVCCCWFFFHCNIFLFSVNQSPDGEFMRFFVFFYVLIWTKMLLVFWRDNSLLLLFSYSQIYFHCK